MRQLQQDLRHVDDRGGHSAGGRQLQVVQRRLHVRLLLREAADLVVLGEFEVNLERRGLQREVTSPRVEGKLFAM